MSTAFCILVTVVFTVGIVGWGLGAWAGWRQRDSQQEIHMPITAEEAAYRHGVCDTLSELAAYSQVPGDIQHFELRQLSDFAKRQQEQAVTFKPSDLLLASIEEELGPESET